jgi:high affinity choline transporter 7
MTVYVWGLAGIAVFYIAMLGVGIWAGTKQKDQSEEEIMLAGRNIGTIVGVLTLIGLWLWLCLLSVFLGYITFL